MSSAATREIRIAVIGAGAAGLGAAWLLARGGYSVSVFEAHSAPGGHAQTVNVPIPDSNSGATVPVDVGFMVYNTKTYPNLVSLFELLNVDQDNSSMSFATSIETNRGVFEWGSDGLSTLFADRANILNPSMYAMLWDVRRFNRSVHAYVEHVAARPNSEEARMTLGEFLDDGGYTQAFIHLYIIPMVSAVWSASFYDALAFPAISLFHFFVNHGLAQVFARPQWRTPADRSQAYVRRIVEDIESHGSKVYLSTTVAKVERTTGSTIVHTQDNITECFDRVVFATHAPTTLKILGDSATDDEKRILGAFKYSANELYVHHDSRLMPRNRTVWSSWNFISRKIQASQSQDALDLAPERKPVCVSYWLNRLQNLHRYAMDVPDLFITLNPVAPIDESKVLHKCTLEHPQFTLDAIDAQAELQAIIQGQNNSWFCGAYARYGFHEDAFMTGLDVAEKMFGNSLVRPWKEKANVAMNDNFRVYEVPLSSSRTFAPLYLGSLAVVNAVLSRLTIGLSKIASEMFNDDPALMIGGGDGRLQRFGPRRAPRAVSTVDSDGDQTKNVARPRKARITIRTPKVLARVTDWLRKGYDLAPIAAASFAAKELDAPSPEDLCGALRTLFIAQMRSEGLADGLHGQMRLAESLLVSLVGGFDDIVPPTTHGRLPELATSISCAVYPAWWQYLNEGDGESGAHSVTLRCHKDKPTANAIRRRLELLGDLSGATIAGLQADKKNSATVVVVSQQRMDFVTRKAQLLGLEEQVTVTLINEFLGRVVKSSVPVEQESPAISIPGSGRGQYDLILSPASVNICEGMFESIERMLNLLRSLVSDDGVVELGFTSYDDTRTNTRHQQRHQSDVLFCGDEGYRIWPEQEVLDSVANAGFSLIRLSQMNAEEAANDVAATVRRVYCTLATTKLSEQETRETMAQLCLWEAALRSRYISRTVVLLKPC